MDRFQTIVDAAAAVFEKASQIPALLDQKTNSAPFLLEKLSGNLQDGLLKIAVVGVIKSGKSTFVNSLIGKEVVKTGAGVTTGTITRIRKGKKNRACIWLKSWDEINTEIRRSLALVPDEAGLSEFPEDFDLRKALDRQYLSDVYRKLVQVLSFQSPRPYPELVMIRQALKGFDALQDLIGPEETILTYDGRTFEKHQKYSGDPDLAFFIKDVGLERYGGDLGSHIEIADCQGSDSTDPSRLARILSYLETAGLIIYVISSRTGLRQSDLVFLRQIRQSGLLNHLVFVHNCDLTEHGCLNDLLKQESVIRENLDWLGIKPEIFTFSALYNLFSAGPGKLSKKDAQRLVAWQLEKDMITYCDRNTLAFDRKFKEMAYGDRRALLIESPLKQILVLMTDLNQRIRLFLELTASSQSRREQAWKTVSSACQNAPRLEGIMIDSLDRTVERLIRDTEADVHQMFVLDRESVLKDLLDYVQLISLESGSKSGSDPGSHRTQSFQAGFYLMFRELSQRVNLYVLEAVRPAVKRFVTEWETAVQQSLQTLMESCPMDLTPSPLTVHDGATLPSGVFPLTETGFLLDMDEIRQNHGIHFPAIELEARYSSLIKTRVFADAGMNILARVFSSLTKKNINQAAGVSMAPAFNRAGVGLKRENRKVFQNQFEHYGNELKTFYLVPMIKASADRLRENIRQRFKQYRFYCDEVRRVSNMEQSGKQAQAESAEQLRQEVESLLGDIRALRNEPSPRV